MHRGVTNTKHMRLCQSQILLKAFIIVKGCKNVFCAIANMKDFAIQQFNNLGFDFRSRFSRLGCIAIV
jgi:hypothetical protein